FTTRKWRRVDREIHRDGGFVDLDRWKRLRRFGVGDRFADRDSFDAGDRENGAGCADRFIYAPQSLKRIELRNFRLVEGSVELGDGNFVPVAKSSIENAPDGQPAQVVRIIEIGYEKLKDSFRIA